MSAIASANLESSIPFHPGRLLAQEIKKTGLTPSAFARYIKVPANRIGKILKGERSITADTALRLERIFGGEPSALYWLRKQAEYDVGVLLLDEEFQKEVDSIVPFKSAKYDNPNYIQTLDLWHETLYKKA